jgi:single stranded DNA-binding protein
MSNLNVTVLMGRLVRTPIIRNNGSKMGFFYVASNRRYRDKSDVFQEETAFVACKCFGAWTDALACHQKGDRVMVEGRLRTKTWNNDGTLRSQLILVCDSVQFVVPEPRPQNPLKPNDGGEREHATPAAGGELGGNHPFVCVVRQGPPF